jgi:hypothetical protein
LRQVDVATRVTVVREFNRDFVSDAWNLNLQVRFAYRPGNARHF